MTVIPLTALDLCIAAFLVTLAGGLSIALQLRIGKRFLIAGLRTTVQLLLVGVVLKALFANVTLAFVSGISIIMLLAAAREVGARMKRPLLGMWGFGTGAFAMFVSSFTVTVLALVVIIGTQPWYEPRYAIPLLGMLLGNTMSGIALGLDRLTTSAWDQREVIEGRLLLGLNWRESILFIHRDSIRTGMIPIINAMAAAGLVSLPGMMTGQILSGTPPMEAVKYQILIMFLIATGTCLGTIIAIEVGARRLFDARHRLRLERLGSNGD